MKRFVLLAAFGLVALLPVSAQAQQTDAVSKAAAALKQVPVYDAPDSGSPISAPDQAALVTQIRAARVPIYLAVLPEGAGPVDGLPHAIAVAMGNVPGVVGVVAGHSFRAGSSSNLGLATGQAGTLAADAVQAHSPKTEGSLTPMLRDFVSRVTAATAAKPGGGGSTTTTTTTTTRKKGSSFPWGVLVGVLLVLILLGVGIGLIWHYSAKARKLRDRRTAAKRRLDDLASDVNDLEAESTLKGGRAAAKYNLGVEHYRKAYGLWTEEADSDALDQIEISLSKGEMAMQQAKNSIAGREDTYSETFTQPSRSSGRTAQAAASRTASSTAPPSGSQPTQTVNINQGYPGTGYGYYPGYGWGYYGYDGNFVMGMLLEHELMEDRGYGGGGRDRDDYETTTTTTTTTTDGGGDWGGSGDGGAGDWDSSPSPSYDPPDTGGGDWGGGFDSGGGGDFGGGGDSGGGDW